MRRPPRQIGFAVLPAFDGRLATEVSILVESRFSHAGATLTLKSNNVTEDRKRIESFGCKILGEADQPWGHMLVFEDPDGTVLK